MDSASRLVQVSEPCRSNRKSSCAVREKRRKAVPSTCDTSLLNLVLSLDTSRCLPTVLREEWWCSQRTRRDTSCLLPQHPSSKSCIPSCGPLSDGKSTSLRPIQ